MQSQLSRWILAAGFAVAGIAHFASPDAYTAIVPASLPFRRELVLLTGVLQILGGAGLILQGTRKVAAAGLIALLVLILPANVQMLVNAEAADAGPWSQTLLWARLPLQVVLMWWVWRVGEFSRPVPGVA